MKNLTAVDTFTDPVQSLEDGDGVVGGNSEVTAQALTNRTKNLDSRVAAIVAAKDQASGYIGLDSDKHAAVTATGSNKTAFTGTGNGTGAGVSGVGGATSGAGLSGTGGAPNGAGVTGQGTGSGTGVSGTGGASSGNGGTFAGGATNGHGVAGTGVGTGAGTRGIGGLSGVGCRGISDGATEVAPLTKLGGHFSGVGTGTASTSDAVQVDQNIKFAGANPGGTTAFLNRLTPANVTKAWAKLTSGGAGAPTLVAGFNVASSARIDNANISVTFAQAMADANYVVVFDVPFGNLSYKTMNTAKTVNGFQVLWKNETTGAITDNSSGLEASFVVYARQ